MQQNVHPLASIRTTTTDDQADFETMLVGKHDDHFSHGECRQGRPDREQDDEEQADGGDPRGSKGGGGKKRADAEGQIGWCLIL